MILIRTHRGVPPVPNNDQRAKAFDRAVSRTRNVEQSFAYQRVRYAMEQSPVDCRPGFDFKYGVAHDAG